MNWEEFLLKRDRSETIPFFLYVNDQKEYIDIITKSEIINNQDAKQDESLES